MAKVTQTAERLDVIPGSLSPELSYNGIYILTHKGKRDIH